MSAPPDVPDVVARAFDASRRRGYASFCRNETGRLLATLAAASRTARSRSSAPAAGSGTAWLRSGVRNGTRILSAELDTDLAGRGGGDLRLRRRRSRWWRRTGRTLRDRGPFSPALPRRPRARRQRPRRGQRPRRARRGRGARRLHAVRLLAAGLTGGRVDALRERWLTDERFTAVELRVAADTSAIVATRR